MKKNSTNLKITALVSGTALLGAMGTNASAANLFDYESLGTASQLRSDLITADAMNAFTANTDIEFECGEGKCGEGKCGDHKKDDKKANTKESKDGKKAEAEKKDEKAGDMKSEEMKKEEKKEEKKVAPKN